MKKLLMALSLAVIGCSSEPPCNSCHQDDTTNEKWASESSDGGDQWPPQYRGKFGGVMKKPESQ